MTFVVDASIALAWCLADEADPAANRALAVLEESAGAAPAIWPLEVANGLRSAERRGRLDEVDSLRVTRLLRALPIRIEAVGIASAMGRVLPMARALGLTAYDAAYVELAVRADLPLATLDDQLARAVVAAGGRLAI